VSLRVFEIISGKERSRKETGPVQIQSVFGYRVFACRWCRYKLNRGLISTSVMVLSRSYIIGYGYDPEARKSLNLLPNVLRTYNIHDANL
jgi:hypothetical protein